MFRNPLTELDLSWQLFFGLILLVNFLTSWLLTKLSFNLAWRWGLIDQPHKDPHRKYDATTKPLWGATGFILSSSFWMAWLWLIPKGYDPHIWPQIIWQPLADFLQQLNRLFIDLFPGGGWNETWPEKIQILGHNLRPVIMFNILLAIGIIWLGGWLDDKYQFRSKIMLLPTGLALVLAVVGGELTIETLSPPFGDLIPNWSWLHYLLAILWIGLCLSATKFLDGLDGLVTSVGIISLSAIAATSLLTQVWQPWVLLVSLLWITGLLGFLPWNWPPAKGYLGEAGSQLIGFIIGVLSILSGAKIATASSVLGWFIIDFVWVMFWRLKIGQNPLQGDRRHWHFRWRDLGFSKVQVLLLTDAFLVVSAILGVVITTRQKVWLLLGQLLVFLITFAITEWLSQRRSSNN
jgi:UDP-GlcNAc:undecaprenyl-phosphate GlcNAc-1-phosphate transferase